MPFFAAPTSIPGTQAGVKQAVTGSVLLDAKRSVHVALELSSYAREVANFTNTEPRFIEYDAGIIPIPVGAWIETWATSTRTFARRKRSLRPFRIRRRHTRTTQPAGLTGVVQTMEALNYLILVWAHDSEGVAITQSPNGTTLPPAVCLKDGLQYIVALLDSANTGLNTAGAAPLPFRFPPGFAAVGAVAGPSTVAGSFAAFNRALAAKAGSSWRTRSHTSLERRRTRSIRARQMPTRSHAPTAQRSHRRSTIRLRSLQIQSDSGRTTSTVCSTTSARSRATSQIPSTA